MIVNGWFDWATKEPGPADRQQPWNNLLHFIVHHSLEGRRGGYNVMLDPNRPGIAWHGTVAYDGTLYQHYPVYAGLFHGGPRANPFGPGFEAEGGIDDGDEHTVDEPLTDAQKVTYRRIHFDMETYLSRPFTRTNGGLVEHGELAQTSCPSHRYDQLWKEISEDMTRQETIDLIRELQNTGALASTTDVLSCIAQIVGAEDNTYSDTERIAKVREAIANLATAKGEVTT